MVAHSCFGLGLSSSRKVWWGAGFRGPYPDGPQTPAGPETPAAALAGARGNGAGSGGWVAARAGVQVHGRETNKRLAVHE